jgi:excinuclease UvrABC ATPase subunit
MKIYTSHKGICPQCKGNGYLKIKDNEGKDQIKQCWVCESEGEVKYAQKDIDEFIYNTYYKRM